MSKAIRKPRPSMPRWYWVDVDNCHACKNRNNCNQCKRLKEENADQKEKLKKRERKNTTNGNKSRLHI